MSMNYPTLALDFRSLFPLGPSGLTVLRKLEITLLKLSPQLLWYTLHEPPAWSGGQEEQDRRLEMRKNEPLSTPESLGAIFQVCSVWQLRCCREDSPGWSGFGK